MNTNLQHHSAYGQTMSYHSIFTSDKLITKKDLCEMLNLNLARSELKFTKKEIMTAYKARALRVHPDRQYHYTPQIPSDIANQLTKDMLRAKDYMLENSDNIPGSAYHDTDWITKIFSAMKANPSQLKEQLGSFTLLSNDFFITLYLAWHTDGKLNLSLLNDYAKELSVLRLALPTNSDYKMIGDVLHLLRDMVNGTGEINIDVLITKAQESLPAFQMNEAERAVLLAAIKDSRKELTELLNDETIDNLQRLIQFWGNFIVDAPRWRHIIGVYFVSLFFTASTVPQFYNALRLIQDLMKEHKQKSDFSLPVISLTLLSCLILPVNIALNAAGSLTSIALTASLQAVLQSIILAFSTLNILIALLPWTETTLSHAILDFAENAFELLIRITSNTLLEVMNSMLFIVTNTNHIAPYKEKMNAMFDGWLGIPSDQPCNDLALTEQRPKPQITHTNDIPAPSQGFFDNPNAIFNEHDSWLNTILANLEPDVATPSQSPTIAL